MSIRLALFAVGLAGCSASGGSASGNPSDGGQLSCDGWTMATATPYSAVGSKLDHFPALLEGTLDPAADTMPYALVLTEPTEVRVRVTMSIAGAGASVTALAVKTESGPTGDTQVWVLGPGILPAGEHPLLVQPGKTGTGPFRVEVEAYGARARTCDPSFVDPSAGATDALASHECQSFLKVAYCGVAQLVDDAENRARYCTVPDAPCARAARAYLSCVVIEGSCDPKATALEGLLRTAPACAVSAAVCP